MYIRSSNLFGWLIFIGLVLLAFAGYQGMLKRQAQQSAMVSEPIAQLPGASSADPPSQPDSPSSLPPVEAVFASLAPTAQPAGKAEENPAHAEELTAIHEFLEQKNEVEAETRLKLLHPEIKEDPKLKPVIAVLWKNLGVLQKERRGAPEAIVAYKVGLWFDPKNPALNLNLAQVYYETHDPALTREFLEQLVTMVPTHPFPHMALADILYADDDLAGAAQHLESARKLAQADPKLAGYLQFVTARVKSEEVTERNLRARESSHFVVKFDGEQDQAIWYEVLTILEDSYRTIGQKLEYFPSQPIHVVLLTKEHFLTAAGTPAWADALYDPVLGRIKIPTQGALTDRKWLEKVLRHEYVHALLHERMGVQTRSLPTWLNEGLAMQLADDSWPDIDELAKGRKVKLIPLRALHGGWSALPENSAMLAYLQGNSATSYMIERYGMGRVNGVLDSLKDGHTMESAIHDKLMISYDTFEQRWAGSVGGSIVARRR